MGGNYQKDLYKQLMEVMARVDGLNIYQSIMALMEGEPVIQ